ncbi:MULTISPECIES: ABC transporter permease [Sporosarcina]|uniref:ABC transporter permease n=1 Tax=Sporosarcina contaminans TaxID=633403 RepID=A0ABW3TUD7_9BACL
MNFRKKYSKMTVLMAMLHGVIIGIAAVAVVGTVLVFSSGKEDETASMQKEIPKADDSAGHVETPTSGPPPVDSENPAESIRLFAKQHGVFSTAESASAFVAEDPTLSKAAVIQAEGQYFVWSAVGLTEDEIEVSEYEGTFRKPFVADTSACTATGAGKLKAALAETDISQIKNLASSIGEGDEDKKIAAFKEHLLAVTAFSTDLRIVRLQLLSHYSHTDNCAKIKF